MKRLSLFLLSFLTILSAAAQSEREITVHDDRIGSDERIVLPEGMTQQVDSLLAVWHARHYLYPDTSCVNPDYNPSFPESVYIDRLRRLPTRMEMPHNAVVQQFIDRYTGKLRRSISYMLAAGNFYVPIFEEALDYYGLPLELKYLPVIESALNPTAVSRAGATGLWQFMLATGKRYGLEVNSLIDERCDPVKATYAAAHYLKDLYAMFGDWNLVIAAYNCGPSTINKAIHRAEGAKDYWTIYPYLPEETRGYVPAFIAANYVMNYYCEHNICPMKTAQPVATDTVVITRDLHMQQVSALAGIDVEAIRALNPQYRTELIPGQYKPQALRLPQTHLMAFIDAGDSVYNYRAAELLTRRSGVVIAKDERVHTDENARVRPTRQSARSSRNARNARGKSNSGRSATVRRGDTLSDIARRNGTTVAKLRRLNKISGTRIKPGQKIKVK